MDLQLFNAVSHVILRGLVISEINFGICHTIQKKGIDDVREWLPNITGMFLWLSKTKNRAFRRFKTVSNILIWCPITSDEMNTFWIYFWFHKFSTTCKKSHRLWVSSEAMWHRMRMFDTVLELPKVILWVFDSHRNIPVMLGNTWSTSVGHIVD